MTTYPPEPTDHPLPLIRGLALFALVAGAFGFIACIRGLFDPDYFWHLATGRLILEERAIPSVDSFSFTWAGRPWTPDQWLAEVAIAAGAASVGVGAVMILFAALAAVGPAVVAASAMRLGGRPLWVAIVVVGVGAALLPQVTIRPQVVSFAMLGMLLSILMLAREGWERWLWLLPPLFLLWANVHGFFIVGLAVGFIYLVATLRDRTPLRTRKRLVVVIAVACLLATMITPSGPSGVLYALSFGDPTDLGATRIQEWQSPSFHNPQFVAFLAIILVVFGRGLRGRPGWLPATALLGIALGLFASRAVGIGVLMAMPMLVVPPDDAAGTSTATRDGGPRALLELGVAVVVGIVLVGAAVANGPIAIDRRRVPVDATAILAREHPTSRVLASYEWGGYLIEELHDDGGRVFVDGRMHKYAPDVMSDYLAIVSASPDWERLVDFYAIEAILLDPESTLVKGIAQDHGWCERYRDDVEVLLLPCETARP